MSEYKTRKLLLMMSFFSILKFLGGIGYKHDLVKGL